MRSGVIAQKLGMTRIFTDAGEHIPVTVLRLDRCQVVGHRTPEKNGYTALQLGAGTPKVKRLSRAARGHFAVANVEPKRKLVEFRVSPENVIEVGAEITADHFVEGQFVDVSGTTIGKGFAGAMKRHNFGGLRASSAHAAWLMPASSNAAVNGCNCRQPFKWLLARFIIGLLPKLRAPLLAVFAPVLC